MRTRQRWLIITHSFDVAADRSSQLVSQRIPYLFDQGIEPFVISSRGPRNRTFPHYQRPGWGPSGLSDLANGVSPQASPIWRSLAAVANSTLLPLVALEAALFGAATRASWVMPATVTGITLTRNLSFDLIYSAGGAASAHLAAALVKRQTGLPWLAELQAPMIAIDQQGNKGDAAHGSRSLAWLANLEQRIGREADHVCFTHPAAMEHASARTPSLADKSFYVLPGADRVPAPATHVYTNNLRLCHFGDVGQTASLAPLVRAIALLREAHPGVEQSLRIRVFGQIRDTATRTALQTHGLESLIEHGPIGGTAEAIDTADCVLLVQGQQKVSTETVPLALYDYVASRRPVMAITHHNAFLDRLVIEHGGYTAHATRDDTIKTALVHLIADWHAKRLSPRTTPTISVESGVLALLDQLQRAQFFVPGQTELA